MGITARLAPTAPYPGTYVSESSEQNEDDHNLQGQHASRVLFCWRYGGKGTGENPFR